MNTSASCPKAWGRTGALAYAGSKPCVLTPAWQSGSSWRGRVSRNWIASGSRCETATRLPTGRVVGCGGVAFGCTSWPAFCLAAGASLPQCSLAGEGPPLAPGTYPPRGGCAAGHVNTSAGGFSPPVCRQTVPAVRPCGCTPGAFWGGQIIEREKPNGHTGSRRLSCIPAIKIPI